MTQEYNPGDYYRNKEAEARSLSEILDRQHAQRIELEAENARLLKGQFSSQSLKQILHNNDVLASLKKHIKETERALERARYVGD